MGILSCSSRRRAYGVASSDVGPGTWGHAAACLNEDPDLFFPVSQLDLEQVAEAVLVCRGCDLQAWCLETALATDPFTGRPAGEFGVWGGTTEDERRELLARRRAVRPAVAEVAA